MRTSTWRIRCYRNVDEEAHVGVNMNVDVESMSAWALIGTSTWKKSALVGTSTRKTNVAKNIKRPRRY